MINEIINKINQKKYRYLYLVYNPYNENKHKLLKNILIEIYKFSDVKRWRIPENKNKLKSLIKRTIKTHKILLYIFLKIDEKNNELKKIYYFLDNLLIFEIKIILILKEQFYPCFLKDKNKLFFNKDLFNILKNKKNQRIYNINNLLNLYFWKFFKINYKNYINKLKINDKNIFLDIFIRISNLKIINKDYKKFSKKYLDSLNNTFLLNFLFFYVLLLKYYSNFMYKKLLINFKKYFFKEVQFKLSNNFKDNINKIFLSNSSFLLIPYNIYLIFFENIYIGNLKKYNWYYLYEIKYLEENKIMQKIIKYKINILFFNCFIEDINFSEKILELTFNCIIKNSII